MKLLLWYFGQQTCGSVVEEGSKTPPCGIPCTILQVVIQLTAPLASVKSRHNRIPNFSCDNTWTPRSNARARADLSCRTPIGKDSTPTCVRKNCEIHKKSTSGKFSFKEIIFHVRAVFPPRIKAASDHRKNSIIYQLWRACVCIILGSDAARGARFWREKWQRGAYA